jgi:hypothetical protein
MDQATGCTSTCHVWQRDHREQATPIPPDRFCACAMYQFRGLPTGIQYQEEFLQPDGRSTWGPVTMKR